jgi:hypothetical protein
MFCLAIMQLASICSAVHVRSQHSTHLQARLSFGYLPILHHHYYQFYHFSIGNSLRNCWIFLVSRQCGFLDVGTIAHMKNFR